MGIWTRNVELFFSNTDYLDSNALNNMSVSDIEGILKKIKDCCEHVSTQKGVINDKLNDLSAQESDLSERLKALSVVNSAESIKMAEASTNELCKIRNTRNKLMSEQDDIENALADWQSKIQLYTRIIQNRRKGHKAVSDDMVAEGLLSIPVGKSEVAREFFK